ncbi:MAG: hypothetical protein AB1486_14275 [Planctomycetota bacterium]
MPIARDHKQASAANSRMGLERLFLAGALLAGFLVILGVSGTAIVVRAVGGDPGSVSPFVAAGVIAVSLALTISARRGRGPVWAIACRLPPRLEGRLRRQPVAAGLAGLLALVAVVQLGRLSCFMADPALRCGSAFPPVEFGVRHMCLSAYVYAADLWRTGVSNVYAEEHYPAYWAEQPGGGRLACSSVANLAPHVRDAFEYAPPFLLLPSLALILTNDFLIMR